MSEYSNNNTGKEVELYDQYGADKQASTDLLQALRIHFRQELDQSGFTRRFLDTFGHTLLEDADAELYVAQTFHEATGVRTVHAVLRQQLSHGGFSLHTRRVGEEMGGARMAAKHFTDEDLDQAINQLADLRSMHDQGIISLDQTLSWPTNQAGLI
ncbi:hypothetical protein KC953_03415 [Candidatus Saccharibacteria bacterium]|nr:hypothetical protein [Candidatus Saccharibacteria bacterium]